MKQYKAFVDGLYFINLIQYLEKKDFKGYQKQPTTKGCCFVNIKMVCKFLREKNINKDFEKSVCD